MRPVANPNIRRLKAVPEETRAMGGVKIPCLALKCLPGCEYLPFSICYRRCSPAESWEVGGGEDNTGGGEGKTRGFSRLCQSKLKF